MTTAPHTQPAINPLQYYFVATALRSELNKLLIYRLDQPFGHGQSEHEDQSRRKDQPEGEGQSQEQGQDQSQDEAQDGSSVNESGEDQERPTE